MAQSRDLDDALTFHLDDYNNQQRPSSSSSSSQCNGLNGHLVSPVSSLDGFSDILQHDPLDTAVYQFSLLNTNERENPYWGHNSHQLPQYHNHHHHPDHHHASQSNNPPAGPYNHRNTNQYQHHQQLHLGHYLPRYHPYEEEGAVRVEKEVRTFHTKNYIDTQAILYRRIPIRMTLFREYVTCHTYTFTSVCIL